MKIRLALAALAVAMTGVSSQDATAQTLTNNLFAQYETPQGASLTTAGMYMAPHFVPHHVGSTYTTYQPLQPHEFLYTHSRNYYNVYAGPESFYANQCNGRGGGSGLNVTKVRWQNGCMHMGPLPSSMRCGARIGDAFARHWYCKQSGQCGLGHRGHGHAGHCHGGHFGRRHRGDCGGAACATDAAVTAPVDNAVPVDGNSAAYAYPQPIPTTSSGTFTTLTDQFINR